MEDAVSTEPPVRVLIVDDDALVRAALRMMLSGSEHVDVAGEAEDGSQVPEAVQRLRPDVVLMDIRMPRVDGLAATEHLARTPSPPQIIVLTTFDADEYVLRALRAGASGFLLKDTPPAELVRAIRTVAQGEAMLSPTVTRRLIDHMGAPATTGVTDRRKAARERLQLLSEREREVAVAVGLGKANAEIAEDLYMSVATVKAHVSRVMTKLDATNRVQIAILAHDAELA
ncbi:response regulator transcription factor [Kineosporia babensis]